MDGGQRPGTTSEDKRRIGELEMEVRELRRGQRDPEGGLVFLRRGARPALAEMVRFIQQERERWGVEPICRVLEVALSSYYASITRSPSERERRDEDLKPQVRRVHEENYGVYGMRKLWRQLRREGYLVGRDQVRRLMAELGLTGVMRGKKKRTTIPEESAPVAVAQDLVGRNFVRRGRINSGSAISPTCDPTPGRVRPPLQPGPTASRSWPASARSSGRRDPSAPAPAGDVQRHDRLGGLLHKYGRVPQLLEK